MCRIIFQSAACCTALPFGTLSYKRHEVWRRFIEYKMCVLIFSTVLSETFLILRRIQRGIIIIVNRFSCKFSSQNSFVFEFVDRFLKSWNIKFHENSSALTPVLPIGRTDGQSDRHTERNKYSLVVNFRIPLKTDKIIRYAESSCHNQQSYRSLAHTGI